MNGLLVRVGADLSPGGGSWNGPIDGETGQFLYVAIPESGLIHAGLEKPYSKLAPALSRFSQVLPGGLANR
ncbi:MAG TPA: hypothetical protein VE309_07730, partial [Caulobacteraceae bacterium]|nr:hypothetical protein [Caulobacteraceae bacterium]